MTKRSMLALVVATLIFGRQVASWSTPGNRFLYFWQRGDGVILVAAVLLTAAALFGLEETIRRRGGLRVRRLLGPLYAFAFVLLLLTLLMPSFGDRPVGAAAPASAGVMVVTGLALWRAERTLVRATVTAGLLLGPLPVILFAQVLMWRSWRECADGPMPASRPNARPVFVLLFDEWSLDRTSRDGEFLPELTRLRQLAGVSFTFQDARSPGDITYKSIPRILFQKLGGLTVRSGVPEWTDGVHARPLAVQPNLFKAARTHGYTTALRGWYLPYAALVGDDLTSCRVYLQEIKRPGALRLWDHLWANLQYYPDPLSVGIWRRLHARLFSENWVGLFQRIENDALDLARHAPANSLSFVHYPLPHAPFIFDENGAYRGPFTRYQWQGTGEEYGRHVRYVDAVVGRFLDALEQSGRLDSALIVVTSDHSWRRDPEPRARTLADLQRVPLLIKWPGQRLGARLRGRFCLLSLGSLIDQAIGDRIDPEEARFSLERLAISSSADRCRQ
jgi:hypothetical protein